jgi:polygalacturonase
MLSNSFPRRDLLRVAGLAAAGVALGKSAETFDIKEFGAKGDGKALDHVAINKAIDAAAASGGTVHLPAGNYLCYSIHLKSNVALYLEQGSTIIAADSPADGKGPTYDLAEPIPAAYEKFQDYGHGHWHNSLIWGEDVHDVSILGPGLIWGKGLSRGAGRDTPRAETPGVGNKAIALKNCRNVILRDFSILHGGHFGILATGADNLTIDNLKIDTNRDGMDIDCCRNVRVSNCAVNSPWDDGICLKSSYGLGRAQSTDNVTITNCFVSGSYLEGELLKATYKKFDPDFRVPRTGRIKFGTESNGSFRNISISNCVFDGCQGLALESVDGALLEDVAISNITMRDISSAPIYIRLGERMRGPEGVPVGTCQRININNIVCWNSASRISSIISGVPGHFIQDVKISDVQIFHKGGGTKEAAAINPPEQEKEYPEPGRMGPMPAQGFFIRHAKNIEMHDVRIVAETPDERPTIVLKDVEGFSAFHVTGVPDSGWK